MKEPRFHRVLHMIEDCCQMPIWQGWRKESARYRWRTRGTLTSPISKTIGVEKTQHFSRFLSCGSYFSTAIIGRMLYEKARQF